MIHETNRLMDIAANEDNYLEQVKLANDEDLEKIIFV